MKVKGKTLQKKKETGERINFDNAFAKSESESQRVGAL